MGVRGLRSYIQEHRDKFLQDFKLKDTKLVIDGSNLIYFLNSHFEEENIYGGNYDHFNTKCRDFFNTLLRCNILPIVVFDGADDPDNMKLETILKRLDERFRKVNKWQTTEEVLPILYEPLLYQILDELKVPHIATVYEADKEIAVLAGRYECPVVTNDSDFYVYDLKGGSISMACMIEKERTDVNGSFYIPVKLYRREAVLKELFKMENDELIFPVFATLTGNDFFDPSSITLNYPKRPREQMSFARRNIRVVVEYVCRAEFESGQKAYDYICSQLSQSQREQFKYSVDSYLDTKQFTLFDLESFIANLTHGHSKEISILYERQSPEGNLSLQELSLDEHEQLETEPSSSTDDSASMPRQAHNAGATVHRQQADEINENAQFGSISLQDKNGNKLPSWFVNAVLRCKMESTFLLNITQNHRLIFKAQPESHELPSSFKSSESIRRVIYRLLLFTGSSSSHEHQRKQIQEFHRRSTDLSTVKPIESLEFVPKLPNLEAIPSLTGSERKAIVYATFKASVPTFDDEIDETSQILILMLRLWITTSKAKECHVNAVLIGIVGLHIVSAAESNKCLDIVNAISNTDTQVVENFKERFGKHFKPQDYMGRHGINKDLIHKVSQFQAIFLHTHYLNTLLLGPVSLPSPSVVLNSTFVYNMCHLLENNVRLKNIFPGEESPLYSLLRKWQRLIENLLSQSAVGKK